jgi:hypothetical protein
MFGTLLESVGENTASAWLTLIRAPAVIFWFTGALAWWLAHRHVNVLAWLGRKDAVMLLALLIIAAALLIGSSVLMNQLARPLLRLLEGYWPGWLSPFRTRLTARVIDRQRRWHDEWSRLEDARPEDTATQDTAQRSPREVAASTVPGRRQAVLDQRIHDFPADERMTMPTRVGNILRSSETYPQERYGLDAVVVWPALWLLLPQDTRDALGASRRSLDQSVAILVALIATLVWLPWSWVVLIVALLGPPVAYLVFVIPRAQAFAQLVKATFDVHRLALYANLRFPLPADPDAELKAGAAVTDYLWRGFPPLGFTFAPPSKDDPQQHQDPDRQAGPDHT